MSLNNLKLLNNSNTVVNLNNEQITAHKLPNLLNVQHQFNDRKK